MSPLENALEYIRRGWAPVPIPHKSKNPIGDAWQKLRITEADAHQYFNGGAKNVGVLLGGMSDGLADIDLDTTEAVRAGPYFLPRTLCFGRPSKPRSHWLFQSDLWQTEDKAALQFKFATGKGKDRKEQMILELRIGGGDKGAQTVFPGSVHETGELITWDRKENIARAEGETLKQCCARAASAALLAGHFPSKGARHDAGLTLGGFLSRCGFSRPDTELFAEAVTIASGQPREKVKDVRKAAREAWDEAGRPSGNARGFPILAETFGDDVAKHVAKWLGYEGANDPMDGQHSRPWERPHGAHGGEPFFNGQMEGFDRNNSAWPEPKPLPDGLLPVANFDPAFLPDAIAPWVMDIAERMQCPPDFVAIPAVVAIGSVIGRKVAVRPQRKTDWYEAPNLWGCIVGRPGAMKSPAMDEALKPLHRLETEARKANEAALKDYEIEAETFKLRKEDGQKKGRAALKWGAGDISSLLATDKPEEPKARRYVVNDATYEALGVILADNPNGTLAFRDELVSLLKNLDREEQVSARGFFLTAWNGTSGYTFDRIIRGKTHIEAACLSLLGSAQPGRLAEYMHGALTGGAGDDGMIQRFSLLVWPDQSPSWENTDRYPASEPRAAAWQAFQRLDKLTADAAGAETDEFAPVPYLRFDDAAQCVFDEWRKSLETGLRSGDLAPALESHLAKYRKLVPSLALINHLAEGGAGAISETAILQALAFAGYLETHARRAYGAGSDVVTCAAKAILKHIRKGDLADGFTARDIHQHGWSELSDRGHVQVGLDLLVDLDWIAAATSQTGGRPRVVFSVNPRGLK
jgi:hypothetical protein